jgi:hypothetical protein
MWTPASTIARVKVPLCHAYTRHQNGFIDPCPPFNLDPRQDCLCHFTTRIHSAALVNVSSTFFIDGCRVAVTPLFIRVRSKGAIDLDRSMLAVEYASNRSDSTANTVGAWWVLSRKS